MATPDIPELEDIYFYQKLTSSFSEIYGKAKDICSIIVIPLHIPITSTFTRDIIESHLFIPSPCFIRKHTSFNEKYDIELDNNNILKVFHKKDGVGEKRIKILGKEDVRNSVQNRSYSILIVEQPLVDIPVSRTAPNGSILLGLIGKSSDQSGRKLNPSTATYAETFVFLDSLRPIENVFSDLQKNLFQFNETYVILPKFVEQAIERLRGYRDLFLREASQILNRSCDDRDLELASEIYITGNTYGKVWPIVIEHNAEKDEHLNKNIFKRQQKLLVQSNEHQTNTDLNGEINLRKLDDVKTALEKAMCIRAALDSAVAAKSMMAMNPKDSRVSYRPSASQAPMAADETLTAFIDLICQFVSTAKSDEPGHLVAHEYYIEKFRFISLPQDVDYAFTTYRGVLEYLSDSSHWY